MQVTHDLSITLNIVPTNSRAPSMKTSPEMPSEAQGFFLFYSTQIETTESHKFAFSRGDRLQVSVLMNFFLCRCPDKKI